MSGRRSHRAGSWCAALIAGSVCCCDAAGVGRDRGDTAADAASANCGSDAPPEAVECQFFFRQSNELMAGDDPEDPKFQFQERVVRVTPDESASETLGALTLAVAYDVPEQEVPTVGVSVTASDTRLVSWLYQLGGGVQNQFVGDHGFTGLVYLTHPTEGGDYQLICKAE